MIQCESSRFFQGDETMHARVVSIQLQPGKTNEAVNLFRDSVVPAAQQQPGFKNLLLLTDPTTGKGLSISLWETEADMTAGEASGYFQAQLAKFGGILAAPPAREQYEVSVQA
jgi:heme-degrading monooxygenase HmoA